MSAHVMRVARARAAKLAAMSVARTSGSRRLPWAAALFLLLSLTLHLALLRSVPVVELAGDAPFSTTPVVIQLQAAAPEARPAPPPEPPKPRKRRAAPKPSPAVNPAPAMETASPDAPLPEPSQLAGEPGPGTGTGQDEVAPPAPAPAQAEAPLPVQPEEKPQPVTRALPPPPTQLHYSVETRRSDGNYQGVGIIRFSQDGAQYSVDGEVKLLFMSLLTFQSKGSIEPHGLAPLLYTEKRFRKSATNTHFQREKALVSFSASTVNFPRSGLEQDRASIVWQLASLGRGDPAQLTPGVELDIFVAGTRDGETWHLQVTGEEEVQAASRTLRALRILRRPRPGSYEQQLDIWLAPALEWYPVKLRFTEPNGDVLDLTLNNAPEPLAAQ